MSRNYRLSQNPTGYLTVAQVAELTGMSASSVYSWLHSEILKSGLGSRNECIIRYADLVRFWKKYYGEELEEEVDV